jgi:hypothetical protein
MRGRRGYDIDTIAAYALVAILVLVLVLLFAGCTPAQRAAWLEWNTRDPAGAQEWLATPDGQASLDDGEVSATDSQELTNSHASRWDRIAWCESGGDWSYPPVTNRTGTYSGGLMIWQKAWIVYGGQAYAGWAYQATKAQQIDIAERILADQGWGAWDCA